MILHTQTVVCFDSLLWSELKKYLFECFIQIILEFFSNLIELLVELFYSLSKNMEVTGVPADQDFALPNFFIGRFFLRFIIVVKRFVKGRVEGKNGFNQAWVFRIEIFDVIENLASNFIGAFFGKFDVRFQSWIKFLNRLFFCKDFGQLQK